MLYITHLLASRRGMSVVSVFSGSGGSIADPALSDRLIRRGAIRQIHGCPQVPVVCKFVNPAKGDTSDHAVFVEMQLFQVC